MTNEQTSWQERFSKRYYNEHPEDSSSIWHSQWQKFDKKKGRRGNGRYSRELSLKNFDKHINDIMHCKKYGIISNPSNLK